ncbi:MULTISPECIES: hypothetical protein [Bacillaceae]|uniref:DUF4179 domain-containing protein n=1 Tax=Evansella alkalicola TaxID=745819 RepID=A0ABS6JQE3_9BACI|nr:MULTISPECIES: hypothetical protein [Bacillaceae]MBU9720773.1 hypothetical protein [Bacillus alkalicola]
MSNKNDFDVLKTLEKMPKHKLNQHRERDVLKQLNTKMMKVERWKRWKNTTLHITTIVGAAAILFFFIYPILTEPSFDSSLSELHPLEHFDGKLTPTFHLYDEDGSLLFEDGVRGIEGKIGYRDIGDNFVAEDERTGGKMFWYVWGDPNELRGEKLVATATHVGTEESFLLNEVELSLGIYEADAHALTSFAPFPYEGIWKIDIEIGTLEYGQITIYVKSPYPQSESITYLISEEDIIVGETLSFKANINKVIGEPSLEAVLIENNTREEKHITFEHNVDFVGESMYEADVHFEKEGEWKIHLLGETTSFKVSERSYSLD